MTESEVALRSLKHVQRDTVTLCWNQQPAPILGCASRLHIVTVARARAVNLSPRRRPLAARGFCLHRLIRTTTQPAPSRFDDARLACSLTTGSRFSQGGCLRGCAGPLSLGLTPVWPRPIQYWMG